MSENDLREAILKLREIIDDLYLARIKYQFTLDEIGATGRLDWRDLDEIEDKAKKRAEKGEKPRRFRF